MKIGLGKKEITPPVGCELAGFGHYLGRRSTAVFDSLYASALAVEDDGCAALLISCDLLLLTAAHTAQVRGFITEATGLEADHIMVCCTHTHSGPATGGYFSLGEPHTPYVENLPWRIAQAGIQAYRSMREGTISHAEVPCEDIAYNRWVNPAPDRSLVRGPGWAVSLKGPVDSTAHVVKFMAGSRMLGFFSYYSVHPVVCGNQSRILHGDLVGVATNRVQQETPRSLGIFFPGACGDINPGICNCDGDQEASTQDLELFSDRYAEVIRRGLAEATCLKGSGVAVARKVLRIPYAPADRAGIQDTIGRIEQWLCSEKAEADQRAKNGKVADLAGWRKVLAVMDRHPSGVREVELMAVRLGGITVVCSPFEIYNEIKQQVEANLTSKPVLVVGFANDYIGYAVAVPDDEQSVQEKRARDYATWYAMLIGEPPLSQNLQECLVDEMTALARHVNEK